MSDILRQVDEDLRKERLSNLWKKYGLYLVAFIIVIVLTVVGYQLKASIDKSKNENLLEIYIESANSESFNQQLLMLETITNSKNIHLSGLADLKIANLFIENKNIEKGLIKLEEIAANQNYDIIINDLATYLLLMIKINELSEGRFMEQINTVNVQNSKFKYLFMELISIKKLLIGKNKESTKGFQELIDLIDTPADIKTRAIKFIEIAK
jgi:hypothetical protein|tara:strand:- start:94 stop:726 length:633 start_codon:yes stop_codon:yes gene_type:complete